MTREQQIGPWADDVAADWLLEQIAGRGITPDDLVTAAAVMNVVSRVDLEPLAARMTTDGYGNPITDTEDQRNAQRVWSQARELQDRAGFWQRAFTHAAEGREDR